MVASGINHFDNGRRGTLGCPGQLIAQSDLQSAALRQHLCRIDRRRQGESRQNIVWASRTAPVDDLNQNTGQGSPARIGGCAMECAVNGLGKAELEP
jgi:hypothetical protein